MERYLIETQHTVQSYTFKDGEEEYVNFYKDYEIISEENAELAIHKFLKKRRFDISWHDFDIDEKNPDKAIGVAIVDEDNKAPTCKQREDWKAGKETLFINDITLKVSIIKSIEFN